MLIWEIVGILIVTLVAILIFQEFRNKAREAASREAGICNFALDQSLNKKGGKEKTSELEREGKVVKIGDAGRGVTYKIASNQ